MASQLQSSSSSSSTSHRLSSSSSTSSTSSSHSGCFAQSTVSSTTHSSSFSSEWTQNLCHISIKIEFQRHHRNSSLWIRSRIRQSRCITREPAGRSLITAMWRTQIWITSHHWRQLLRSHHGNLLLPRTLMLQVVTSAMEMLLINRGILRFHVSIITQRRMARGFLLTQQLNKLLRASSCNLRWLLRLITMEINKIRKWRRRRI